MRRTLLFLNISFFVNCYSLNFQQSKISEAMSSSRNGSGGRNGGRFHVRNSSKARSANFSAPVKVAGEKGAESHTVSEDCRIRLTQMLLALRESSDEECKLEFTSELSNTERKFLVSSVKISSSLVSNCEKLQYSTPSVNINRRFFIFCNTHSTNYRKILVSYRKVRVKVTIVVLQSVKWPKKNDWLLGLKGGKRVSLH